MIYLNNTHEYYMKMISKYISIYFSPIKTTIVNIF